MDVQALRTLFNVAHRLHPLLGSSWLLVIENMNSLDRILNSPRTTTQVQQQDFTAQEMPFVTVQYTPRMHYQQSHYLFTIGIFHVREVTVSSFNGCSIIVGKGCRPFKEFISMTEKGGGLGN